MKKKGVTLFAGIVGYGLLLFGEGGAAQILDETGELKVAVQDRILAANRAFREAVTNSPDEEYAVTASFTRAMPPQEAVEKVLAQGFIIEGFHHGDDTHSGGYIIAPGQSLEVRGCDDEVRSQYPSVHRAAFDKHRGTAPT